jgi:hypothetical protein
MKKILLTGLVCALCASSAFAAERIVSKTVVTTEEKVVQNTVVTPSVRIRPVGGLVNVFALNRAERRARLTQRWADVIESQTKAESALKEASSKR